MTRDVIIPPAPSRTVSIAVSAALVVVFGVVRLVVFDTMLFPIAYVLPLLVCIWTRDRIALWAMAVIFAQFHAAKLYWILPEGTLTPSARTADLVATLINLAVGALAVHIIIALRSRLETALQEIQAQSDELRAQGEELAQQNEELSEQAEELSRQTEELSQQGEEMASQNEELQLQSQEISALNAALARRERLLEALLDTARLARGEATALQHIAEAATELFGEICSGAAIYELGDELFRLRARAPVSAAGAPTVSQNGFAAIVVAENKTAAINDVTLRPDLCPVDSDMPVRAVLAAPVRVGGQAIGAFAVHSDGVQDWTDEQFRLAEWLADQCSRALQASRVQDALREADQRKSEFLATLSHELRNPLAPIRFALKLIEQGGPDQGNALRVIERQFQQLVRLVDDLLDATRLSSNKIQLRKSRVDLVTIVQQAVDAVRPDVDSARHTLVMRLPSQPIWLDADGDRIAQIATNLLNNAARYTPPGGTITIAAEISEAEAILSVADTGVGLHAEDLNRVFDMFVQIGGPGSGGLGIGLAIVRGIAELHGGRVDVHSDGVGHGSEFKVALPLLAEASVTGETEVMAPALAPTLARRVLVVDDNTDATEMMATLLELHGHSVWVAHDAEAALIVAREITPEVALLDIGLPGLDGYELARRLRQGDGTRHMRLIAVTGWGQDGDRAKARAAGFDAHLTKPAEPATVLEALAVATVPGGLSQGVSEGVSAP